MEKTPVDDLFSEVEIAIDNMKANGDARPVQIKSCLEHLRSSLEYLANDIYELLGRGDNEKIYFPYGQPKFISTYLSKLNTTPDILSEIESLLTSIQPYHTGQDWLTMMCNLTNDAKHRRPTPINQDEVITGQTISAAGMNLVRIEGPHSGRIEFNNCMVNGAPLQNFVLDHGVMKTSGIGVPINIKITKEKKIRFHGHDYEVVPFLEKCLNELKEFTGKGYSFIRRLT